MRCPNCGNENPADYVFCDECGARLQNTGGTDPEMTSTPLGAQDNGASDTGGAQWQPSGDMAGMSGASGAGAMDAGMSTGAGPEADTSASSSEYAMPTGGASEGEPMDAMGGGSQSGQGEGQLPGGDDMQDDSSAQADWPPMGGQSIGDEGDDDSAAMPVTEDTMESAGDGEDEALGAAMGGGDETGGMAQDDEYSMPGVVPLMGSYSDADSSSGQASSGEGMGATGSGSTSGGGEWASAALNYLEQAQQSAGQGNWSGFGEAMDSLRTYLQTASQGVQGSFSGSEMGTDATMQSPGMGSMAGAGDSAPGVGSMDMGGEMDASSGMGDMGMSGAMAGTGMEEMPDMSGGGAMGGGSMMESAPLATGSGGDDSGGGIATLEPAAEAGSLGADLAAEPTEGETTMARLVMIATGAELPLPSQEEITVGREDPSSGIFPDIDLTPYGGEDGGVSRRHARLLNIGDEFFVEDLQSTNYTKLDGQRLPAHVRERLEDGARLDFGRVATIFRRS